MATSSTLYSILIGDALNWRLHNLTLREALADAAEREAITGGQFTHAQLQSLYRAGGRIVIHVVGDSFYCFLQHPDEGTN
jgi:hypothetical protein